MTIRDPGPCPIAAAISLTTALLFSPAHAVDIFWNNEFGGWWDDPTNWTNTSGLPRIPQAGDTVFLTQSYFSIVPVFYRSAANPVLGGLYIDSNNHLLQSDVPSSVGDIKSVFEIVGWDGRGEPGGGGAPPEGSHIQRFGANQVGTQLIVGDQVGSIGHYELIETGRLTTGTTWIGNAGKGNFNQRTTSGHQVAGDLILGKQSTGDGTYTLSSGFLVVGGAMTVGDQGVGEMEQTLGISEVEVSNSLVVGNGFGSNGTYQIQGGTLETADTWIGNEGEGQFTQSGAATRHDVAGDLILGKEASGNGSLTILSSSTLDVAGEMFVGIDGTGNVVQTADPLTTATGEVVVGSRLTLRGRSTYRLEDGELRVGSTLTVPATTRDAVVVDAGTFEQTGGRHLIGDPGLRDTESVLRVGSGGNYELHDGELLVYGRTVVNGTFLQTNGKHHIGINRGTDNIFLSRSGLDIAGRYEIQDGELVVEPTEADLPPPGGWREFFWRGDCPGRWATGATKRVHSAQWQRHRV